MSHLDETKSQIGLGNCDNTSDVNKPVSTAQQTALNLKADTSSLATYPHWIKITKSFSDFSIAALTNAITIYSLPAKGAIHASFVNASTTFSGGLIASYTVSIGIGGVPAKYNPATNIFTGASIATPSVVVGVESMSGSTNIVAQAISTIGNLNAATQGSVDIYLLISTLE